MEAGRDTGAPKRRRVAFTAAISLLSVRKRLADSGNGEVAGQLQSCTAVAARRTKIDRLFQVSE
ncbi:MAG: hypothetical protein DIU65_13600 [Proteobacteria bacterium]|nr:MAG: hypothetical protein DIU65_13600 [Pseudomonadota bacterium]